MEVICGSRAFGPAPRERTWGFTSVLGDTLYLFRKLCCVRGQLQADCREARREIGAPLGRKKYARWGRLGYADYMGEGRWSMRGGSP